MQHANVAAALDFKSALELSFETAVGIGGRAHYSAVYSLPQPSPVMWVNLNPGGTAEDHHVLSDYQLAQGEHEFWHGHGKTSKATGAFLQQVFDAPLERLRSIQGTNVAWERSHKGSDINLRAAAKRAAPFLKRYIQYVRPNVLMFGGSAAFDLFVNTHEISSMKIQEELLGNWGSSQARIFVAAILELPELGRVQAVTVSHPSRGTRLGVAERVRAHLTDIELPKALA